MKTIFIFIIALCNALNAQNFSCSNIINFQTNEYMTYKGISSKKRYGVIIRYETSVTKEGFWQIKENYVKGYVGKVKNVFDLEESDLTNIRRSQIVMLIDLNDMRTVSSTAVDYYDFGSSKETFDIRGSVSLKDKKGEISIFSMYGISQIARAYPFKTAKKMLVRLPIMSEDAKIKIFVQNNGVKSIKINSEVYEAYEIELKIEGSPIAIFFPRILAYIENGDSMRMFKYNSGAFDNVDFYLTDYGKKE